MRFDLEFKLVSTITTQGLSKIAESLYGETPDILPMFWDENAAIESVAVNHGNISFSGYNQDRTIPESDISSGVNINSDSFAYLGDIQHRSAVTPVLAGGGYSSGKSKFLWSKNAITKPFEWNGYFYTADVDTTIDINNTIVFTIEFQQPGNTKNKKKFVFVPWDEAMYQNLLEDNSPQEALSKTLKFIFKASIADNKFTLFGNKAYLNSKKIEYKDRFIGTVGATDNTIMVLPECPAVDVILKNGSNIIDESDYTISGCLVVFKNGIVSEGDNIYASYIVKPIISYMDKKRNEIDNSVYSNINLHPRMVNNKNGVLCLSPAFGNIDIPLKLTTKSDKESVYGAEPFRITSRLSGVSETPVVGKEVTLSILSANAIFNETNTQTITKRTISDGTISANIVSKFDRIGYFIQKEWVSNSTTITIPYTIPDVKTDDIFVYFVTADDPILGKISPEDGEEEFVEKYWEQDLKTYTMNGRKIAYVSLQNQNGVLRSRFVKPSLITYPASGCASTFRNLPVDSTGQNYSADPPGVTNFTTDEATVITFDYLPDDAQIIGYWLITNGVIRVKAEYTSPEINLYSDDVTVELKNVRTENAFTLNRYGEAASQLGAFGYYTISEYLKNPYALNACSIYCVHSDCIQKKCIHPDVKIRNNFILDNGGVGCAHNKQYDQTHTPCPGEDAHLVNPFIMHLEVI